MTDDEKTRILNEGVFYHVTPLAKLASIRANGLDPARSDRTTYGAWLKGPAVFLCTLAELPNTKEMFDDGLDRDPHVVLKVAATAVAEHECDVDRTFPDRTKGLSLIQCLEQAGFIACYGRIAPDSLEVLEQQDSQGRWQREE